MQGLSGLNCCSAGADGAYAIGFSRLLLMYDVSELQSGATCRICMLRLDPIVMKLLQHELQTCLHEKKIRL